MSTSATIGGSASGLSVIDAVADALLQQGRLSDAEIRAVADSRVRFTSLG